MPNAPQNQWIIFLEPEIISCLKPIRRRRLLLRGKLGTVEPNNKLFFTPVIVLKKNLNITKPPYHDRANNFFRCLGPSLCGGSPVWRCEKRKTATDYDVDERSGVKHSRLLQRPAAAGSLKEHRVVQCLGSSLMLTGRFFFFFRWFNCSLKYHQNSNV